MPAKPWPPERDDAAADVDVDVVPVREAGRDALERRGIGARKVLQRLIGEHDAPAERVVGRLRSSTVMSCVGRAASAAAK